MRRHLADLEARAEALARELAGAEEVLGRAAQEVRALVNDLADVREFADELASLADLAGAPGAVPEDHRLLDVTGPRDQVTLDGEPLEWMHGDGQPRPVTRTAECGRLLLDLASDQPLDAWEARALSRAVQQLRRCPELGRDGVVGRGRKLRLAVPVRLAPALALRTLGKKAARGRGEREG